MADLAARHAWSLRSRLLYSPHIPDSKPWTRTPAVLYEKGDLKALEEKGNKVVKSVKEINAGVDIPQICTFYSPPYIFRG